AFGDKRVLFNVCPWNLPSDKLLLKSTTRKLSWDPLFIFGRTSPENLADPSSPVLRDTPTKKEDWFLKSMGLSTWSSTSTTSPTTVFTSTKPTSTPMGVPALLVSAGTFWTS